MREKFDKQLAELNAKLTHMGSIVEQAIELAISALVTRDAEKARKTMQLTESINQEERSIEAACFQLLAMQQPVARDLRMISSAMKLVTDIERIGIQAADIAEISIFMADRTEDLKKLEHLQEMAKETTVMVIKSLEAFVMKDKDLALEVISSDDVVDELFSTVKNELVRLIHENPQNGEQATDLLMVAKYFERIGDHAVNIAEWVIFSITGKRPE